MQYKIKVAPPSKRLFAAIIDILLIIPLITIAILATNFALSLPVTPNFSIYGFEIEMDVWAQQHFWQIVLLYSLVKLTVLPLYFILSEASNWQGTPGKRLLKIKVTDITGQRITIKRSAIRFFSKIISTQLLIGYIMILFTKQRQGLHDFIAKTLVQKN